MKKIPTKYQPKGFKILYEDDYIIVGEKAAGVLSVRALWNKEDSLHALLNEYVRKGNSKSKKCVYVVHRLDQDTSGVLVFAKTEKAQTILKDNWKTATKIYYAIVHGHLKEKTGTLSSYLLEDEDYIVYSAPEEKGGRLSQTAYEVVKETVKYSLVKINLLTGRKNQIRVQFADIGHPVVGDDKYGRPTEKHSRLALHAQSISLIHPFTQKPVIIETKIPEHFDLLLGVRREGVE